MTQILLLAKESVLSPSILFFLLGAAAGTLRSDLTFPDTFGKAVALYMMLAIGFAFGESVERRPPKQNGTKRDGEMDWASWIYFQTTIRFCFTNRERRGKVAAPPWTMSEPSTLRLDGLRRARN